MQRRVYIYYYIPPDQDNLNTHKLKVDYDFTLSTDCTYRKVLEYKIYNLKKLYTYIQGAMIFNLNISCIIENIT